MVIGLTGPKLSGKGTTSEFLQQHCNAKAFSMSGVLVDIANRLHIECSRKNLIALATNLREAFGTDILAQVLSKDIKMLDHEISIIDGIRFMDEIDCFKQLPDFHLIYIDAPLEERYKRSQQRTEKVGENTQSFEDFSKEENAVTEKRISELHKHADATIQNDSSFDALYKRIQEVLNTL